MTSIVLEIYKTSPWYFTIWYYRINGSPLVIEWFSSYISKQLVLAKVCISYFIN